MFTVGKFARSSVLAGSGSPVAGLRSGTHGPMLFWIAVTISAALDGKPAAEVVPLRGA